MEETKLKLKREMFCHEFMVDFNATAAATRSGYSPATAQEQGSYLLSNVIVQERIAELMKLRLKTLAVSADMIISELQNIASADPAEAYNPDGSLKNIHDIPVHLRKAISQIESDELFDGKGNDRGKIGLTKKLKFWPKEKALEQLAKYKKLYADLNINHTGTFKLEDLVNASWSANKPEKPDTPE